MGSVSPETVTRPPHAARPLRERLLRHAVIAVLVAGLLLALREAASFAAERATYLDTVAMTSDERASIHPDAYAVRLAMAPAVGPVEFRLSEHEAFVGVERRAERYLIPARWVHGTEPLPIQVRYTNLLGSRRTRWMKVEVREALSRARTISSFEALPWAEVAEGADGLELHFNEHTDEVATVSYALDGAPSVKLPVGVERVPLASRPAVVIVELRTLDGSTYHQRVVDGRVDLL